MRRDARTLSLVLLLLVPLAAGAPLVVKGGLPPVSLLFAPQLHCEIVFDAPGFQRCDVPGSAAQVNEIRLRMAGPGRVFAYADEDLGGNPPLHRQLGGALDCARSCVATFPATSAAKAWLYVYADSAAAGTTVSVTLQQGIGTELL